MSSSEGFATFGKGGSRYFGIFFFLGFGWSYACGGMLPCGGGAPGGPPIGGIPGGIPIIAGSMPGGIPGGISPIIAAIGSIEGGGPPPIMGSIGGGPPPIMGSIGGGPPPPIMGSTGGIPPACGGPPPAGANPSCAENSAIASSTAWIPAILAISSRRFSVSWSPASRREVTKASAAGDNWAISWSIVICAGAADIGYPSPRFKRA